MRGTLLASAVVLAGALLAPLARAGDDVAEARAEYDAAAAAYDRKEYVAAATRFARADERAPNPQALRLAMAAVLQTKDGPLAMTLVERSEGRAVDPATSELARKLRARFEPTVGHVRPVCAPAVACRATIDDVAAEPGRGRWVSIGRHVVVFEGGAVPTKQDVMVQAGDRLDVTQGVAETPPSPPPAVAPPPEPKSERLSPAYFWTGTAVTGAAVVGAAVLTVVVASKHDDFVAQPSAASADAGSAAQTRARVAWGAAGAFAATTVVLGLVSGTF